MPQNTNYRFLRLIGGFLTVINGFFFLVIVALWFYAIFTHQGVQPFEIKWALPVFGMALGEICKAVADIADQQVMRRI